MKCLRHNGEMPASEFPSAHSVTGCAGEDQRFRMQRETLCSHTGQVYSFVARLPRDTAIEYSYHLGELLNAPELSQLFDHANSVSHCNRFLPHQQLACIGCMLKLCLLTVR